MGSMCSKCSFRGSDGQQTGELQDKVSSSTIELPVVLAATSYSTHDAKQQDASSPIGTSSQEVRIQSQSSLGTSMASDAVAPPESHGPILPSQSTVQTAQLHSCLPLWDNANSDEQEIVSRSARYKDVLRNKLDDLTQLVLLPDMWATLKALRVLDQPVKDRILQDGTQADAIERLVHYLECGPTWKMHGFFRALAKTNQTHIIKHLGLEPSNYKIPLAPYPVKNAKKHHYYKSIESEQKIQISNDMLPGLLQHCGSYNHSLMKASLFGYKKNVPIDLTRIYICHDAHCKQNQSEKLPIGKDELFKRLFATRCPNCLSMEGQAGTGKSSYLEKYAHDWSQDVTLCEQKGPTTPCEGHLWKLVVYISAGAMKGSAVDAIKENLRCKPKLKDQMMHDIEEDGEGVLTLYDAMDELRCKKSIESISSYVETAQKMVGMPKVLVAARDGLLSVERSYFDRILQLEGFTQTEGIEYTKQYFKVMHSISDHPVLQYVEAHPQDLDWVLSNPLRVHILSELTACRFLTVDDLKTLTTVKLFRSLDQLLLIRDKECRPPQPTHQEDFHEACLRCLLTNQRILSDEDVGTGSAYLSLLKRHDYMDKDFNDCCSFTFPHETLFEYFSMRGLIECLMRDVDYKKAMLLWLCSEPKMRNVVQLTCGYIAQYEPQLLPEVVFILKACLLLQTEIRYCEDNELTQELLQLPTTIQQTFPPNILTHGLTTEQTTTLDGISNQVEAMFSEKADQLKDMGWFINGYAESESGVGENPFHTFLLGCLQQLTTQQQRDVFRQTIALLLPCTRYKLPTPLGHGRDTTVLPASSLRWATIQETYVESSGLSLFIRPWCPGDLLSILNTWSHLPETQRRLQKQEQEQHQLACIIEIDRTANRLCTTIPADQWSEQQWTPGLRELLSPKYRTHSISPTTSTMQTPPVPLSGLLSACTKVITGRLSIMGGYVTESELKAFCAWATDVRVGLNLSELTVVLAAGCSENDIKDIDSAIKDMVDVDVGGQTGSYRSPMYITADKEEMLCETFASLLKRCKRYLLIPK